MIWLAIATAKAVAGGVAWLTILARGEHLPTPLPPAVHALLLAVFVGVGLTLIAGSRRELPARWLGLTFCLFGSLFADPLLAGVSYHRAGLDGIRHGFLAMSPVAMVPLYFWRFAWDFPRRQPALLPAWAPRRIEASLFGVGLALFVAMLVTTLAADGLVARTRDVAWTIVVALQFPTLALLIAKVRTALPEERRRVALFIAGLVLGMVPLLVDILLSGFVAPYRGVPLRRRVGPGPPRS